MNFNSSETIAIIAVMTPYIVNLIQYLFDLRLKKFELLEEQKRTSLTNFIDELAKIFYSTSRVNFFISYNHLVVYFKVNEHEVNSILEYASSPTKNIIEYQKMCNSLIKHLSAQYKLDM